MPSHRRKYPVDPEIGNRIAGAMKFHGWSQKRIAEALGITPPAVSQWMTRDVTERVKPSEETAHRLADLFGEDVDFLMNRSTRGTKGWGLIHGTMIEALGPDHLRHLGQLSAEQIREMVEDHELKLSRSRRRQPAKKPQAAPAPKK